MRQLHTFALLLFLATIPAFAYTLRTPFTPDNSPLKPSVGLRGGQTSSDPSQASSLQNNATRLGGPSTRIITLGTAAVPLTGPWKFHTGDNMEWAQPDYDDSAWGTMDLTPPKGSYDPIIGSSGFVPGWTARGYPGYSGYAWYRLRVNIQNGQNTLALKMPSDFDDIYQVYVNGQWIGQFGRFTAHGVTAY